MKELFSSVKNKSTIVATSALVVACSAVSCFADDSVTTSITTSLTKVQTDALGAISAVAPIALSIMGVFLVWKYGVRFFKSVSK